MSDTGTAGSTFALLRPISLPSVADKIPDPGPSSLPGVPRTSNPTLETRDTPAHHPMRVRRGAREFRLALVPCQIEVRQPGRIGDAELAPRALREAARLHAQHASGVRLGLDVERRAGLGVSDQLTVALERHRRARG